MDHYETLGLPRDCTQADIKKAYHKLSLQSHPDKNLHNSQEVCRCIAASPTARAK